MQKSYALTKLHIKSCCATRSFVPLWDYNSVVRWSSAVSNVPFTVNGLPDYENLVQA